MVEKKLGAVEFGEDLGHERHWAGRVESVHDVLDHPPATGRRLQFLAGEDSELCRIGDEPSQRLT
jgi:hypothetical protein